MQRLLDSETRTMLRYGAERAALESGGVDNWEFFTDSLRGVDRSDDAAWVNALEAGGVGNWAWCSESMAPAMRYVEYLDGLADGTTSYLSFRAFLERPTPEEESSGESQCAVEVPPMAESELMLRSALSERGSDDEATAKALWARDAIPSQFERSLRGLRDGLSLEDVRQRYVTAIVTTGALDSYLAACLARKQMTTQTRT